MKKKTKTISKNTLLIIVGFIFLVSGYILITIQGGNNEQPIYIDPNAVLSNEEAGSLINDLVGKVVNLYEEKEGFTIVKEPPKEEQKEEQEEQNEEPQKETKDKEKEPNEENPYLEISNYEEVVKALYTEDGIKELESTKFNKKEFIKKEENKVFILKDIPEDNQFKKSKVEVSKIDVKKDSITAVVQFTKYGLIDDDVTYYVITKSIKLVKQDNKWLISSFEYANES